MSVGADIAAARPRVIAALAAQFRDIDLAEDAFAEGVGLCMQLDETPQNVGGWLFTAAKRRALDMIRKRQAETRAVEAQAVLQQGETDMGEVIQLPDPIPDERLRLIFICCHPSIAPQARTALALKVICGLPVSAIAKVFLTSEATMFQRITRAKAKIQDAGIAFELPPRKFWAERLDAVLLTLELAYTVAYQDAAGEVDPELSAEIARLTAMVAELLPEEPEALGLAALVALARSREAARIGADGAMVPLSGQDPRLWDRKQIETARQWLDQAARFASSGPYQIMAAIQLTHARRAFDGKTDWRAILALYDVLLAVRPRPMVALNRAMALAKVEGAAAGLTALESLPVEKLRSALPWHVARAHLLTETGQKGEAKAAFETALALDPAAAERMLLERKLAALSQG